MFSCSKSEAQICQQGAGLFIDKVNELAEGTRFHTDLGENNCFTGKVLHGFNKANFVTKM